MVYLVYEVRHVMHLLLLHLLRPQFPQLTNDKYFLAFIANRCRHGGHAHHMLGWFANQKTCPVSGCNCECQFDGVKKLNRPALCMEVTKEASS